MKHAAALRPRTRKQALHARVQSEKWVSLRRLLQGRASPDAGIHGCRLRRL